MSFCPRWHHSLCDLILAALLCKRLPLELDGEAYKMWSLWDGRGLGANLCRCLWHLCNFLGDASGTCATFLGVPAPCAVKVTAGDFAPATQPFDREKLEYCSHASLCTEGFSY